MVIVTIFFLAIKAPSTPAKNEPTARPKIVVSQVYVVVEATRWATASGVAGSINLGGVGLIQFATIPIHKEKKSSPYNSDYNCTYFSHLQVILL